MNVPTVDLPRSIEELQTEFITLLPKIESIARFRLRHVVCSDRRADFVCETISLCWKWYIGLSRKGRKPAEFLYTFATLATRAALSGRRLCGCEKARDALSLLHQRTRNIAVSPLIGASVSVGTVFEEALSDNTQTPVLDQVQFRLDFRRWRGSLRERSRSLMDAMAEGHQTHELATMFRVTPARISQVRRELQEGWQSFCGDNNPGDVRQVDPVSVRRRVKRSLGTSTARNGSRSDRADRAPSR